MKSNATPKLTTPACEDFLYITPLEKAATSPHAPLLIQDGMAVSGDKDGSHTCVIGGPGSQKTRSAIVNSIMASKNAGESMVVLGSGDDLFTKTAQSLREAGYLVQHLNLAKPASSMKWNPFLTTGFYTDCEIVNEAEAFSDRILRASYHHTGDDIEEYMFEFSPQRNLLTLAVLCLRSMCELDKTHSNGPVTLGKSYDFLNQPILDIYNAINHILERKGELPYKFREFPFAELKTRFHQSAHPYTDEIRTRLLKRIEYFKDDIIQNAFRSHEINLDCLRGRVVKENPEWDGKDMESRLVNVEQKYACFVMHDSIGKPTDALASLFIQMAFDRVLSLADETVEPLPKVHFILDEFQGLAHHYLNFSLSLHRAKDRARFTFSMQSPAQMPESEQERLWYNAVQTFLFTSGISPEIERFLCYDLGCHQIAELYEQLRDPSAALLCLPGKSAYIGDKADYKLVHPELK